MANGNNDDDGYLQTFCLFTFYPSSVSPNGEWVTPIMYFSTASLDRFSVFVSELYTLFENERVKFKLGRIMSLSMKRRSGATDCGKEQSKI